MGTDAGGARARAASAAGRPAECLQRRASGARAAHRVPELQPVALRGHGHLGHRQPAVVHRLGVARPLSRHAAATGGRAGRVEHHRARRRARCSPRQTGVPAIPNATTYTYASPNRGSAALRGAGSRTGDGGEPGSRAGRTWHSSNGTNRAAIETLDRVAQATAYTPTVAYPNNGFALALRTVAGAIVRGIGSKVFWVQTGGFDTHAQQGAGGRRLRQSHGHAGRRALGVLHRRAQPGPGATTRR